MKWSKIKAMYKPFKTLCGFALCALSFLSSCTTESYEGEFFLEQSSKDLLPVPDSLTFENQAGDRLTFHRGAFEQGFNYELMDSDQGFIGGQVESYGDMEYQKLDYNSSTLKINYHLYVVGSNGGQWDFLNTTISDQANSNKFSFRVINAPDWGNETLGSYSYINYRDTIINDIFWANQYGLGYVFQKNKGLIKFDFDNDTWLIVD